MTYDIITDSSANLTNELIDKYDIKIVSLEYIINGKSYISYVQGATNELKTFYSLMRDKKPISTSATNPDLAKEVMEASLSSGKDIFVIGFSSALSATFNNLKNAANELKEKYPNRKIVCVDSLCAALGQGLLVYYAAENKEKGMSLEENEKWVESNKLRVSHWFTVEDLYYLHKGGRLSAFGYVVANTLQIKPVLNVDNGGHLKAISKSFGRKSSIKALAAKLEENIENSEAQTIFISHGDCIDDINFLVEKLKEKNKFKDIIINDLDPVIGAHSGPGTIALFFLSKNR